MRGLAGTCPGLQISERAPEYLQNEGCRGSFKDWPAPDFASTFVLCILALRGSDVKFSVCFVLLLTYASAVVWAGGGQVTDQQLASLLEACRDGDCQSVRAHLGEKPSLARKILSTDEQEQKCTALDVAAAAGYAEIVRLLLAAGADVNSHCGEGVTPLMQVSSLGRAKTAKLPAYLRATASAPSLQPAMTYPRDYLHCLRLLIRNGADTELSDQHGRTAPYYAAREGHLAALELLLSQGADVQGWSSWESDPLYAAAFNGRTACVQVLLAAGCPIITAKKTVFTALNGAAQNGHADVLECLLQQGISANAESEPFGGTPLFIAAVKGQLACMQVLLACGIDIDRPDQDGRTALYDAAGHGQLAALELLLLQGAKVQGWRSDESDPLCIAAFNGHIACVRALLAAGSPIVTGKKYGYNALNCAAQNGHVDVLQCLLQQGMSANVKSAPSGGTPLFVAAEQGQTACIQTLLDAGADIDHSNADGHTALYLAVYCGQLEAVEWLLARGAKVQGWRSSKSDPLCIAACNGHMACVKALLAAGAPIITGKKYGFSALNSAAQNGHVEILEYLLQKGVSVNAEGSSFGGTPLWAAAGHGRLACMQLLLDAGADIDRSDVDGQTALYRAAQKGQLDAVSLLLANGAHVDFRDHQGETALLAACKQGYEDIVAKLLAAGANPSQAASTVTPLCHAVRHGHPRIVEQLLTAGANPSQTSGFFAFFGRHRPSAIAQRKMASAVDAESKERYAEIIQLLRHTHISSRSGHLCAAPSTEKTPLLYYDNCHK